MKRSIFVLVLWVIFAATACKRDPSQYSAAIVVVDSTQIVFELRAPRGTRVSQRELSPGGRETERGPMRWDYQWRWLSRPLESPMCFEFEPSWPHKPVRRCIPLPYPDAAMRRMPPRGQFAVVSEGDPRGILVAAPGARSLTVANIPVSLDAFGVGLVRVDLRERFFATPRPSPNDWQTVSLPVVLDGATQDTQIRVDGAQWILSALEGAPLPASTPLDGVLVRSATGTFERTSGTTTFPRLFASETRTQTPSGSCYGRRKIAVRRIFVVRDLRTGQVHSERTFAPRDLAGCPREYVIDLNDRRGRLYEPEESEVREWLSSLRAR
ncbi:MAG: hypothetical protein JNK05_24665 [Myxococcales bacterium]|nr:hypothetical protein [Myxococcales bacterium]